MVDYWIAESPWPEIARQNQKYREWRLTWPGASRPPKRLLGKLKENAKAVIYQPGKTRAAKKANGKIEDGYKHKFIGNFTVGDYDPKDWRLVKIKETEIWEESDFVDIRPILDYLECTSKYGPRRWGLLFFNKIWIPISKRDYDLIMKRHKR